MMNCAPFDAADYLDNNAVIVEYLSVEFTNGEAIGVRLRPKPSKGKK